MEIVARIDNMRASDEKLSITQERELTGKRTELFEELMACQRRVFLICLGFSRNASDAQDLAQEVYFKAYKNIGALSDLSLAKFWLFRIARNTCLNYRKKQRLDRVSTLEMTKTLKDPPTPESEMIQRERLRRLKGAIQELPKKQRDVFVLKEYGDLSYREIAETLKIEIGTVMSRLNRARQAIRERLKGEEHV